MRGSTKRGWMLCLALCVACFGAGRVSAQAKRDSPEYQNLVQQALREYELGNFSEAKAFFSQAHALSPSARTLRGLGMSTYELRRYVEAIGYFQQALDAGERPLTMQMRGEVNRLLQQARGFVTRVRLKLDPASADVRVDTRAPVKDDQGFVLLDPGNHEIAVEARDYEPNTRSIRTDGGEELSLSISLRRTTSGAVAEAPVKFEAPAPTAAPVASTPVSPLPSQGSSSVGPWVLIGTSAAVVIAGGIMLGVMANNMNTVSHPPAGANNEPPHFSSVKSAFDSVLPLSIAGFTCLGVGAAGLIGGIAWKASTGDSTEHAGAHFEVLPGSVRVHGRF